MYASVMTIINLFIFLAIGFTTAEKSTTEFSTSSMEPSNITTPVSSTTTVSPPDTTSSSSSSTSTELPTTTSGDPFTTKGPEEGSWSVSNGNITCMRAELAIKFTIAGLNDSVFLSPNASSERSDCNLSNTTQALVLAYENYVLTFEFEKDSTSTYVRNVTFAYKLSAGMETFYNETKLFLVKTGNSYLCKTSESVPMGNATMYISKIQIEAFGTSQKTEFSTPEECELDDSVSDIVPIAVACALAGLIVLVLITYLVGRRRTRQKGYTSV